MSRKGNKLLLIPNGVSVEIKTDVVKISSSKGQLEVAYPKNLVKILNENNHIKVERLNEEAFTRSMHGTVNSNINNALIGLSEGYKIILKIVGVGYRAAVSNNQLNLQIGFSHPVVFAIPQEVKITCVSPTEIHIEGYDKIVVGELAANIRAVRKPEPYNGKGIMYANEHIIRKVGKTAEGSKK